MALQKILALTLFALLISVAYGQTCTSGHSADVQGDLETSEEGVMLVQKSLRLKKTLQKRDVATRTKGSIAELHPTPNGYTCESHKRYVDETTCFEGSCPIANVSTAQQCANACTAKEGCFVTVYTKTKDCYLKSDIGSIVEDDPESGFFSCARKPDGYGCELNKHYLGEETCFQGKCPIENVSSERACAEECNNEPGCNVFVYNKIKACYLKSNVGDVRDDDPAYRTYSCEKDKVMVATHAPMVTEAPNAEVSTCEIAGDPHISTFDRAENFNFLSIDVQRPNYFGDVWLVKSEDVEIQGRYVGQMSEGKYGSALVSIAIGGSFINGHKLIIKNEEAQWWNTEEDSMSPVQFDPDGQFEADELIQAKFTNTSQDDRTYTGGIYFQLPSGLKLTVNQSMQHISASLTSFKIFGGQDGLCGNFNGNTSDDSAYFVAIRLGAAEVAEDDLLFQYPLAHYQQHADLLSQGLDMLPMSEAEREVEREALAQGRVLNGPKNSSLNMSAVMDQAESQMQQGGNSSTTNSSTNSSMLPGVNGSANFTAVNGTMDFTGMNGTVNVTAANGTANFNVADGSVNVTVNFTRANASVNSTAVNPTMNVSDVNGFVNVTAEQPAELASSGSNSSESNGGSAEAAPDSMNSSMASGGSDGGFSEGEQGQLASENANASVTSSEFTNATSLSAELEAAASEADGAAQQEEQQQGPEGTNSSMGEANVPDQQQQAQMDGAAQQGQGEGDGANVTEQEGQGQGDGANVTEQEGQGQGDGANLVAQEGQSQANGGEQDGQGQRVEANQEQQEGQGQVAGANVTEQEGLGQGANATEQEGQGQLDGAEQEGQAQADGAQQEGQGQGDGAEQEGQAQADGAQQEGQGQVDGAEQEGQAQADGAQQEGQGQVDGAEQGQLDGAGQEVQGQGDGANAAEQEGQGQADGTEQEAKSQGNGSEEQVQSQGQQEQDQGASNGESSPSGDADSPVSEAVAPSDEQGDMPDGTNGAAKVEGSSPSLLQLQSKRARKMDTKHPNPNGYTCELNMNYENEEVCFEGKCPLPNIVTAQQCANACTDQEGCTAFVYNKNKECYLKSNVGDIQEVDPQYETFSCQREPNAYACESNKKYAGEAICFGNKCPITDVASANDCAEACTAQPGCAVFVYNKNQECYLKSNVASVEEESPESKTLSCEIDLVEEPQNAAGITCAVFGDPHINTFDQANHENFLAALASVSNSSGPGDFGDFWLVRSEDVHIQGRYMSQFIDGQSVSGLTALAVGGPFLKGHKLMVGWQLGDVNWLSNDTAPQRVPWSNSLNGMADFEADDLIKLKYNNLTESVRLANETVTGLIAELPLGLKLTVNQLPYVIAMKLAGPKLPGGQDGQCGNYNGSPDDDAAELVSSRMGSVQVADEDLLFDVPLSHVGHSLS